MLTILLSIIGLGGLSLCTYVAAPKLARRLSYKAGKAIGLISDAVGNPVDDRQIKINDFKLKLTDNTNNLKEIIAARKEQSYKLNKIDNELKDVTRTLTLAAERNDEANGRKLAAMYDSLTNQKEIWEKSVSTLENAELAVKEQINKLENTISMAEASQAAYKASYDVLKTQEKIQQLNFDGIEDWTESDEDLRLLKWKIEANLEVKNDFKLEERPNRFEEIKQELKITTNNGLLK